MTLTGVVVQAESGIPIRDANIQVEGSEIGAATNLSGEFEITLQSKGYYKINVSAIGFEAISETVEISGTGNRGLSFELTSTVVQLDPVMVLRERSSLVGLGHNFLRIPGSVSVVTRRDLEKYHDTDINQIVARIPGVYVQEEEGYGLRPNIGMRGTGVERSSKINLMEDGLSLIHI